MDAISWHHEARHKPRRASHVCNAFGNARNGLVCCAAPAGASRSQGHADLCQARGPTKGRRDQVTADLVTFDLLGRIDSAWRLAADRPLIIAYIRVGDLNQVGISPNTVENFVGTLHHVPKNLLCCGGDTHIRKHTDNVDLWAVGDKTR